jgi:hypothetical protein
MTFRRHSWHQCKGACAWCHRCVGSGAQDCRHRGQDQPWDLVGPWLWQEQQSVLVLWAAFQHAHMWAYRDRGALHRMHVDVKQTGALYIACICRATSSPFHNLDSGHYSHHPHMNWSPCPTSLPASSTELALSYDLLWFALLCLQLSWLGPECEH